MKKKVLSIVMALSLMVGLLPTVALAAEDPATAAAPAATAATSIAGGEITNLDSAKTAFSIKDGSTHATVDTDADGNIVVTLKSDIAFGQTKITIKSGNVIIKADSAVTISASLDDIFTVDGGSLTLGANLTITNNSTILYVTKGSATIDGAKLSSSSNKYPTVLATGSETTLTVTGGEIKATHEPDSDDGDFALGVQKGATATVTGGTISAVGDNALVVGPNASAVVSGGTVESGTDNPYSAVSAAPSKSGVTGTASVTISGNATIKGENALSANTDSASVAITGGTIQGKVGVSTGVNNNTITITGGTFLSSDGQTPNTSISEDFLPAGMEIGSGGTLVEATLKSEDVTVTTDSIGKKLVVTGDPGDVYTFQVVSGNSVAISSVVMPAAASGTTTSSIVFYATAGSTVNIWVTGEAVTFDSLTGAPTNTVLQRGTF